jgi:glycosyltransferase involved in cell wall biosynthesis
VRNKIKFTIVIPTRERADTLVHTIASVLAQDYKNYEILISDNASQDNTSTLVAEFNDSRIRYVNTQVRLSMSHNWEFALNHVDDGWITFLGDDDALLPGALATVEKIIEETGTLAIRSNGCGYTWPSLLDGDYGNLSLRLGNGYRRMNSARSLSRVMNGELHYNMLPMLYNGGFVDLSLIIRAKALTHRFYLSMTPDVYSAMVFALLTDEYIYSNEPLAINGASHHSGGTAAFESKKIDRNYNPAQKYWGEDNIPFHEYLPLLDKGTPVRSIAAHVYEAYLQAAPFHYLKRLNISPEQQLSLILRTASSHSPEVLAWGKVFAERHRLNFEDVRVNAFSLQNQCRNTYSLYVQRIEFFIFTLLINGNSRLPLRNVQEASMAAGALKKCPPTVLQRIFIFLNGLSMKFKVRS